MKFKFCGNVDCPDWLISEITLLTKINTIKLRIISNNFITCILNNGKNLADLRKSLEEMKLNPDDASIVLSVLEFIFKNSAKFDIEDIVLNQELLQLGIPQENADSISKVFKNQKENLKNKLRDKIFCFNKVIDVEHKISYVLADHLYPYGQSFTKQEEAVEETIEKDFKPLDTKIDMIFKLNNNVNESIIDSHSISTISTLSSNYHLSTNKITLNKMVSDLEKALELIKKYKNS